MASSNLADRIGENIGIVEIAAGRTAGQPADHKRRHDESIVAVKLLPCLEFHAVVVGAQLFVIVIDVVNLSAETWQLVVNRQRRSIERFVMVYGV